MKQLDLVQFLTDNPRELRAVVTAKTLVKLNKKDSSRTIANPFDGGVYKTQTIIMELNKNYEKAVNAQRVVEGKAADFEAQERKWGNHVNGAISQKGNDLYVSGIVIGNVGEPKFTDGASGREVLKTEFEPFQGASSSNKSQGVEDYVDIRSYGLTGIEQITITTKDGVVIKF